MADIPSENPIQDQTTTFVVDEIPARPPVPPDGYGPVIAYSVYDEGHHIEATEHDSWAARRLHKPDPRLDFAYAVRTWAEHGVRTYMLFAEAECETFGADGEPNGSYSATCWWERDCAYPHWSPWYSTGDLRSPATTKTQIIENGDWGIHWPPDESGVRSQAAALEGN